MSESPNDRSPYRRLSGLDPGNLMAQGASSEPEEDPDFELAGFDVQEVLGQGGMGTVYLGRQLGLDRLVAIKRVSGSFQNDPLLLDRLELEAQTMARLQHPNIVTVHQFEKLNDGGAAIVMEYVPGGTLRDLIEANPKGAAIDEVQRLMREIGGALSLAHSSGVIHRDMKPENVLIDQSSVARVTDFGLAVSVDRKSPRLTLTGTTVGTVDYLAPERLKSDEPPDAQCDVFAVGVILYELLVGVSPRGSFDAPRKLRPEVPGWLSEVTMKALRPDPGERFTSMEEFLEAFDNAAIPKSSRRFWLATGALTLASWGGWKLFLGEEKEEMEDIPEAGWIDLLGSVDLERDTIHGEWTPVEDAYVSTDQNCILMLKRGMPEAYEIRAMFQRIWGEYSIAFFISANDTMGSISLNSWGKELQLIDPIVSSPGTNPIAGIPA